MACEKRRRNRATKQGRFVLAVGRFGLNAHWSRAVRLQKPSAGDVEADEGDAGHFRYGVWGFTFVPVCAQQVSTPPRVPQAHIARLPYDATCRYGGWSVHACVGPG